jgi:hypothetical protein
MACLRKSFVCNFPAGSLKSLYFRELFLGNIGIRDIYRLGYVKVYKESHALNRPPTRICLVQVKTNAKNYFTNAGRSIMHGLWYTSNNYGKIPVFLDC